MYIVNSPAMTTRRWFIVCILVSFGAYQSKVIEGAKILLYPSGIGCNSRLRNMQKLGHILASANHTVHMIMPDNCDFLRRKDPRGKLLHIDLILNEETRALPIRELTDRFMNASVSEMLNLVFSANLLYCESMLQQPGFMDRLSQEGYDLGIYDIIDAGGILLIQHLNIPVMWYSNFGFMEHPQLTFPTPLAYYPMISSPLTDRMTFLQRVRNVIEWVLPNLCGEYLLYPRIHKMAAKYGFNLNKTTISIGPEIAVYLLNTNNAIEYPRPRLPNVVMIGGIYSEPSKPLPQDLEEFIQGSEHGIVVVIFGTNDFTMFPETVNRFARAFAKLKQRVIWKYSAEAPDDLGNNTLLKPFLPQNDLLGHPMTKLFVTHCGISSTQEAAYHGVPIVAVPILGDQQHNANKLVIRAGIGQQINLWDFTETDLHHTIEEVLSNASYRYNAQILSRRYVDQPMPPKDLLLYWVDHVSKNGVLEYLQPRAAWELSWAQYLLLDVIAFFVGVGTITVLIVFLLLKSIVALFYCAFKRTKGKVKVT